MMELEATLNICLANTFLMYFKAHSHHWNVQSKSFMEHHEFFGGLYEDLWGAVDPLAENLRKLGAMAPTTLKELQEYATLDEKEDAHQSVESMMQELKDDNDKVVDSLNKLFELATKNKKQGLANFAADRLDTHAKHGWMLDSYLKG